MSLQCNSVFFKNQDKEILSNISLSISNGECISIIGKSGSGKSTFLKLLSNLISPTSGSLFFDEKPYDSYNPVLLRRFISYCPQLPYLFGNTVMENLSFPFAIRKQKVDIEKIKPLLSNLKLDQSFLEKDIYTLSGGEKQRIALIRQTLFLPRILLLDEITSSLDEENKEEVLSYIKELNNKGVSILCVTHNEKESCSIFKRRLTIENGKLIKDEEEN